MLDKNTKFCYTYYKIYHFDYRGSTVVITNMYDDITDTFEYDTYGKCISRTGTTDVIFGYNGRDGVVTDQNGLIYMRARYYSPDMKRFINADIVAGEISNAITLNRFAYANGNPVSLVDPMGLGVLLATMGLIALGALIGGAFGGGSSYVGQRVSSEIAGEEFEMDWEQFWADTAWGGG